jgi:membrane fusion protein, copper/silver efflux system
MLQGLYSFDPENLLEGKQAYYNRKMAFITDNLSLISKTNNIEDQRLVFLSLSSQVFGLIKSYGIPDLKVYQMYCPMANNNGGAFWLSLSEEITNPYLGEKMLTCGEIYETVEPRKALY